MARKLKNTTLAERWVGLGEDIRGRVPHLNGVLVDEESFIEIRVKVRPDGTCLAILKRFGADGTPMVCFGSGYGVIGAFIAIDGTVQAGNWKVEKPWPEAGKS